MMITVLAVGLLLELSGPQVRSGDATRLIRAEVGPRGGTKAGTFVLDEQREMFDLATDKEVIVAFEWDGPPATHRCELSWIAPDGTVALQTVLDLSAKGRRFSGFWSLLLNPTMARGLWAAEVKVDGVAAGTRTFRVQGPQVARTLPPDQLYKLASDATLSIEARLPPGAERRIFSGFALADDAVITTFGAINAASSLQVTFSDGTRVETDEIWHYSRDLDWALLRVAVPAGQKRLPVAETVGKVGDSCAFLNILEGQKELAPCSVLGHNTQAAVQRLTISNRPSLAAFGAPLLSSTGEIIGMIGVESQPGGAAFDEQLSAGGYRVGSRVSPPTLLALPVRGINRPENDEGSAKLAALWTRGLFFKPVTASRHVSYGFLSAGASGPKGEGVHAGSGFEFYARDGILTALLQWQPRDKLDTSVNHACFDSANRLIVQGKPLKASLRPGTPINSSSQIDVSRFAPGEYRLDMLLGDEVAWRTYFKIRP